MPTRPSPVPTLLEEINIPSDLFWEENKFKILYGAAGILILALLVIGWVAWQKHQQNEAETLFSRATTPAEWRGVLTAFPNTPAAGNAALLLAANLRNAGSIKEANTIYQQLLEGGNSYALQSAAALGLAQNELLSADGKLTPEVMTALQATATRFPESYAAPFALYVEGNLLLQSGKNEEAMQVFRNLLADHPGSLPGQMASSQLQRLAPLIQPNGDSGNIRHSAPSAQTQVVEPPSVNTPPPPAPVK